MNPANQTFRCPHCKKMNLPDAEYCNFCGKVIGAQTIERIRQRKRDFVMIGMEMNLGILDDCFQIVFKKMIQDEFFMKWNHTSADLNHAKDVNSSQNTELKPEKSGRNPQGEKIPSRLI